MKTCVTCHLVQPLTEFNLMRSAQDGRQDRCRTCCRAWYLAHRDEHRANVRGRAAKNKALNKSLLGCFLLHAECLDCGERDVRVLEFDHQPGQVKTAAVSVLVDSGYPWETIAAEIAKCDVRCCNCHRRMTTSRGGHWREALHELAERDGATSSADRLRSLALCPVRGARSQR